MVTTPGVTFKNVPNFTNEKDKYTGNFYIEIKISVLIDKKYKKALLALHKEFIR